MVKHSLKRRLIGKGCLKLCSPQPPATGTHLGSPSLDIFPLVGDAASPQIRPAYAARRTSPMHIDIYAIYVSAFIKRRVKHVLHLSKRSTLPPSKLCKAEIQFIKRRATQNRKPTPNPHLHQDNYHNPPRRHIQTNNPHKTNTNKTPENPASQIEN
jgi:hypothetical protein